MWRSKFDNAYIYYWKCQCLDMFDGKSNFGFDVNYTKKNLCQLAILFWSCGISSFNEPFFNCWHFLALWHRTSPHLFPLSYEIYWLNTCFAISTLKIRMKHKKGKTWFKSTFHRIKWRGKYSADRVRCEYVGKVLMENHTQIHVCYGQLK